MNDGQEIRQRETIVCGESVLVYSGDGWRWFSDLDEARQSKAQHEKFLAFMRQSLLRSSTFAAHERKPRGPNKMQRAADEHRRRARELSALGLSDENIAKEMFPDEFLKATNPDGIRRLVLRCRRYVREANGRSENHGENSISAAPGVSH